MRTIDLAVLGLVARAPATGYDVARRLRDPVGHYWTESHGGVYPALARLEDAGLVTAQASPGPGPRDKKTYTATRAGIAVLGSWAATAPHDPPPRDELLLRVSSLWAADPHDAAAMLGAEVARWDDRATEYAGIVAAFGDDPPRVGSARWCALQTARRGVQYAAGRRDWCREVLAELAALPVRDAPASPDPAGA